MPNVGPMSNRLGSTWGAPGAYTDCGPPDRMIALGLRAAISATEAVCGTTSEYTHASRTRRAISWAYWAPKSTTRTRSWSFASLPARTGATRSSTAPSSWLIGTAPLHHAAARPRGAGGASPAGPGTGSLMSAGDGPSTADSWPGLAPGRGLVDNVRLVSDGPR